MGIYVRLDRRLGQVHAWIDTRVKFHLETVIKDDPSTKLKELMVHRVILVSAFDLSAMDFDVSSITK